MQELSSYPSVPLSLELWQWISESPVIIANGSTLTHTFGGPADLAMTTLARGSPTPIGSRAPGTGDSNFGLKVQLRVPSQTYAVCQCGSL